MRTYTLQEVLALLKCSRSWLYRSGLIRRLKRAGRDRYVAWMVEELAQLLAIRRALIALKVLPPNHPLQDLDRLVVYEGFEVEPCPACGGSVILRPPRTREEIKGYFSRAPWPAACGWCGWQGQWSVYRQSDAQEIPEE